MMVFRVHQFVDFSGSRGTEGGGGVTVVDPSTFEISEIKKYLFYKCSKVDITAVRVRCSKISRTKPFTT